LFKFVAWQVLQNYVSNMTQSNARFLCDTECLAKPPPQKRGYLRDGDILLLVCSFVRMSAETRTAAGARAAAGQGVPDVSVLVKNFTPCMTFMLTAGAPIKAPH